MSISGNQAQAVFLVEKSELNAIWNKYLNDRAYADAADRGVIYKCVFEKLHRSGYVMTVTTCCSPPSCPSMMPAGSNV